MSVGFTGSVERAGRNGARRQRGRTGTGGTCLLYWSLDISTVGTESATQVRLRPAGRLCVVQVELLRRPNNTEQNAHFVGRFGTELEHTVRRVVVLTRNQTLTRDEDGLFRRNSPKLPVIARPDMVSVLVATFVPTEIRSPSVGVRYRDHHIRSNVH